MNRAALVQFLAAVSERSARMYPGQIDRLGRTFAAISWQQHVTDDVFRCELCGVQDVHAPDCPVLLLVAAVTEPAVSA